MDMVLYMNNTVFLHAHAMNIGNGKVAVSVNVSASGHSEANAISNFRQAHKREFGIAPPAHEIRLLSSRPVAETQRVINAVKKYEAGKHAGVHVTVLRVNAYNGDDSRREALYCPDAHRGIKSLTKQARGW